MKRFFYAAGLFLWVAFAFNASLLGNLLGDTTKVMSPGQPQVCHLDNCVSVEVESKPEDLERGLMFRTSLDQNKGMLFVFAKDDDYSFWMKNMHFNLDMLWIDHDGRIVYIASNVPACTADPCPVYTPHQNARYVLELNTGYTSMHQWKLGDKLLLKRYLIMHAIFIVIDLILLAFLVWFFIQNTRLNRALNDKNKQLEATIMELKAAQVKLMDSGKKGAVAALSAGLLHQISQPITAIHGFLRFMKKEMDINSPFYKPVCVMDEQSFYIKDMLANLMELVRHRKIQKTQTNTNAVIYKAMNLLLDELRIRRIGWDMQLDDKIPFIFGDPLHLQQVFMNLVVNAMEALSEMPHGAPRNLLVTSKYDSENHQAVIIFKDNGPGIAHEHQAKIFDPFFSTKSQGSGIGLALCHDLVNEHGGNINVESDDKGTIFTVKLPCVRADQIRQESAV